MSNSLMIIQIVVCNFKHQFTMGWKWQNSAEKWFQEILQAYLLGKHCTLFFKFQPTMWLIITSIYKYIILCLDNCPKPNCADVNEQLKLQSEGQLSTVEEENDLFEKPEDDSVTTSTSVYVAQPGSPESGENYFF